MLVVPLGQNIEAMANKVEELSNLDKALAEEADRITDLVNSSLIFNSDILREQTLCLWATTPQEKLIHQLNAESIILAQNSLLAEAELLILSANVKWGVRSQLPQRASPPRCFIPGPLLCISSNVFSLKSIRTSAPGGVLARTDSMSIYCHEIFWDYASSEVKAL